jgi:hypothetical protein
MNNAYCSIGHISKAEDIETLERMLMYNYEVISKFNYIVIHQNCNDSSEKYLSDYNNVWKKIYGKDVIILPTIKNRGHTFGYIDCDNTVVNFAKTLPIDFIFKGVNDILLSQNILKIPLSDEYGFYFLQGIGYTGLESVNYDIKEYLKIYLTEKYLYPQTNFYIITKNIDTINDVIEVENAYTACLSNPNYNGRPWESIQDFSCENLLKKCIFRNKLKYKHLISDTTFLLLLNAIKECKICDCSHKNIYIEEAGVCHFHNPDNTCLSINLTYNY